MNVIDPATVRLQAEFATAAHNLREPLRMIRCYADLLREQPNDAGPCIEQINAGVHRLETLITGMFECFQLPDHFQPKKVDMNLVFINALTRLDEGGRQAVTSGELPEVYGDSEMLTEVLSKLIDNALKFHGESPAKLHLSAAKNGDRWTFAAKDNGIGIEPPYRERVFGMFKRLHTREVPGEGFGLAYCARAIEIHGGKIWIESESGEGTTVCFTLPEAG